MVVQDSDPKPAYQIESRNEKHAVTDRLGQTILVCGDAGSAGHYAALLNQAFDRGYKTGFRDASD